MLGRELARFPYVEMRNQWAAARRVRQQEGENIDILRENIDT